MFSFWYFKYSACTGTVHDCITYFRLPICQRWCCLSSMCFSSVKTEEILALGPHQGLQTTFLCISWWPSPFYMGKTKVKIQSMASNLGLQVFPGGMAEQHPHRLQLCAKEANSGIWDYKGLLLSEQHRKYMVQWKKNPGVPAAVTDLQFIFCPTLCPFLAK